MVIKGKILEELKGLEETHAATHDLLQLKLKPKRDVIMRANAAKGKVVLVPSTVNIQETSQKLKGFWIDLGAVSLGSSVCGPREEEGNLLWDKAQLSPFFMVRVTHKEDEANMTISKTSHGEYHIPVMKNSKALKEGEVLTRYEPKPVGIVTALIPAGGEPPVKKRKTGKQGET